MDLRKGEATGRGACQSRPDGREKEATHVPSLIDILSEGDAKEEGKREERSAREEKRRREEEEGTN